MPLKLVPDNTNIGFVRLRFIAFAVTMLLTLGSLGLLATKGLNLGVDFVGGLTMEVEFKSPPPLDALRARVDSLGVGQSALQEFGSPRNILIRLPLPEGDQTAVQRVVAKVRAGLQGNYGDLTFRRVESVSGKVSGELIESGIWAVVLSMAAVALFTWFRFEWYFGISTVVALVHDVVVTLGFFALTQLEFDLNVVAAVLTIIGYSLNDKVVIDDRIRENLRKYRTMDIGPIIDLSVNETLPRTVMTSVTLLAALASMLLLGPDVIFGFTAAMMLGIVVGTYSSIFVSSSLLISLGVKTRAAPEVSNAERVVRR
ncbi:protein translocase subunit SecF [Polymorphobacter fuscus]|uniref:Protein-export membrane protein SecF n=1 Tax=Sandarakinorhabdus fusca TaxID=1439888 RepID=A0A7C9GMC5_9SPHN|nr:protein translocase subunit SecF [Polymorphobacter fuscus]KAB7648382.1 protein translocase subunit SecF [Polymorphobacter fuscus]MQT15897.1 protein translocase subunit SecF [Polymorphobacter fuscus]NJC07830.1 preprotein translocase subunit SecF [Polymorphobacter fuscus]